MGAGTKHRQAFLKDNPVCAFCGGHAAATTIEHCPPRSLFQFRQWPEGFEFPACEKCNHGTDDADLLIAMIARMDPVGESGNRDGRLPGLMRMTNKQFPELFKKMMPSAVEARRHNRELGIKPPPGQTHFDTGVVKVPEEMNESVKVLARKLIKGIYYRESKAVFPNDGCLLLHWFTNVGLIRDGKYVVFDLLKDMAGTVPTVQRAGTYLNDQFEYKLSLSVDNAYVVLQARFGNAFGFVVFGSSVPSKLEGIIQTLREKTERNGPLSVLQSPIL